MDGDPRLYAAARVAEELSESSQPLVPERLFVGGDGANGGGVNGHGLVGTLLSLLVGEKSGFTFHDSPELARLKEFSDKLATPVMESMIVEDEPSNGHHRS